LREGNLGTGKAACILTCNWHNWKFDLSTGETLVGGDKLRRFPIRRQDARIEIEIVPEDSDQRRAAILSGLERALHEDDSDRQVREVARLMQLGLDPHDALRHAIHWARDRLEFGTTHAIGAAPDWLQLGWQGGAEERLIACGEILGHLSDDARDRTRYPVPDGVLPWDEAAFATAIEAQDEATALRLMRGGLAVPLSADSWRRVLAQAALAHYADFGHALIYSVKTIDLLDLLGPAAAEPLLAMLVRSLCYAQRDDLLPEFRSYADQLRLWGTADAGRSGPAAEAFRRASPKSAMATLRNWSAQANVRTIWPVLVEAAAWQLLHADERHFRRADQKIADNANWLDLTHALTFADAGETAAALAPELWPAIMLQLACFIGRNSGFVDAEIDTAAFAIASPDSFWPEARAGLFDHGRGRFIISAHLIKTLLAAERLARTYPQLTPLLAGALDRFLQAALKERHLRRTARQMLDLVAQEWSPSHQPGIGSKLNRHSVTARTGRFSAARLSFWARTTSRSPIHASRPRLSRLAGEAHRHLRCGARCGTAPECRACLWLSGGRCGRPGPRHQDSRLRIARRSTTRARRHRRQWRGCDRLQRRAQLPFAADQGPRCRHRSLRRGRRRGARGS
jgi:hypothetical protein